MATSDSSSNASRPHQPRPNAPGDKSSIDAQGHVVKADCDWRHGTPPTPNPADSTTFVRSIKFADRNHVFTAGQHSSWS